MLVYDVLKKKRDGYELSKNEIEFFVEAITNNEIEDYQISAFLMAIFINKMTDSETFNLTNAIVNSGEKIDLSWVGKRTVDKHSTGGVGDKTTLIVGPMVASLGVPFIKMSGRGLGFTGGTLDKLESIEGLRIDLSSEEIKKQGNHIGIVICGQTSNIAPADKKLYAIRDVTATIDNISLIASSIMSKKLAMGADSIILDVKVGSGAFMKNIEDATKLAELMVKIGTFFNRKTVAILTDMNEPLGFSIGNKLEILEVIETLKGNGPKELTELCIELGIQLIKFSDLNYSETEIKEKLYDSLINGSAYNKFIEMVKFQGGKLNNIESNNCFIKYEYKAPRNGYIGSIATDMIGKASLLLGAGRENIDDIIDMSAGIILNKKLGNYVKAGEIICTMYANDYKKLDNAKQIISQCFMINDESIATNPIVLKIID